MLLAHKCIALVMSESARLRALKNVYELPVICKANSKACVMQQIFLEWFNMNGLC